MRNSGEPVSLEGVLERIVFFNEENCFCIASLRPSDPSYRENVTVSGIMPAVQCGETVLVRGEWAAHPSYGARINVREFESRLPSNVYGIEKYLGSGLVEGIGRVREKNRKKIRRGHAARHRFRLRAPDGG